MSGKRSSDNGGGIGFAILVFLVVLWLLRWFIVAALLIAAVVLLIRHTARLRRRHRAHRQARAAALRERAEIQNTQVLLGDPAGFFGDYPIPDDPELIPRWYRAG